MFGKVRNRILSIICSAILLFSDASVMMVSGADSAGYTVSVEESVEVLDFNNITALNASKKGGTVSNKHTRDGNACSIYWGDHSKNGSVELLLNNELSDWSAYERLNMWIYSEKATGEEIMIALHSKKGTDGLRYLEEWITVDWTGWKLISIRMSRLYIRRRTPVKTEMSSIAFRANGWTVAGNADTKLYISDIELEPLAIDSSIRYAYGDAEVNDALSAVKDSYAVYAGSDNVVTDEGVLNMSAKALWKNKMLWLPESFFKEFLGMSLIETDENNYIDKDGTRYFAAADTSRRNGFSTYIDGRFAMIGKDEELEYFRRDGDDALNIPSEIIKYFACHNPVDTNIDTDKELKKLKDNWRKTLLGTKDTNDISNSKIAKLINSISSSGQDAWNKFKINPEGNELFSGTKVVDISSVSSAYGLILKMAKAWGTYGSSLYMNEELRSDILYAIKWMDENAFGMHCLTRSDKLKYTTGGWFSWEIGVPMQLTKILMIMENELTRDEINSYLEFMDLAVGYPDDAGANTVRFAYSIIGSAALRNDAAEIIRTNARVDEEFLYKDDVLNWRDADVGQGFHSDGSYLFHYNYSMNGLYGLEQMETATEYLQILNGTAFMPTIQGIDYMSDIVFKAFDPLIFRSGMYKMTMGRKYNSNQFELGARISACMLRIMDWADEEDIAKMKSIIKEYQANSNVNFYSYVDIGNAYKLYDALENPMVVARDGAAINKMYHNMDQMAHSRKGYGLGLAMHSSRVMNYEAYTNENERGWYMSDGRYEYMIPGSVKGGGRSYWHNVDYYKLPGTTVDTQPREAVAIADADGYRSSKDFVGGVSDGEYGVATMQLEAFHNSGEKSGQPLHTSDLEAKKSYFMFDDEIVCLGTDIKATNNNNAEVLTVIDNRLSERVKTVSGDNGTLYVGAERVVVDGEEIKLTEKVSDITGASWVNLENTCGYYFPKTDEANPMYARWTPNQNSFFELWMSHGTNPTEEGYAYAILPGKSAEETKAFAQNPSFEILANRKDVQAVRNSKLGITQAVFHKAGSIAGITVDKPMVVMVREKALSIEVTASDPTGKLDFATVRLDKRPGDIIKKDSKLNAEFKEEAVIFADFSKSKGRSMMIEFEKEATIKDIIVSDFVSVSADGKAEEASMLILAEYSGDKLIQVKIAYADTSGVLPEISLDKKPTDGSVIKAFLWDSSFKAIISEPKTIVFD